MDFSRLVPVFGEEYVIYWVGNTLIKTNWCVIITLLSHMRLKSQRSSGKTSPALVMPSINSLCHYTNHVSSLTVTLWVRKCFDWQRKKFVNKLCFLLVCLFWILFPPQTPAADTPPTDRQNVVWVHRWRLLWRSQPIWWSNEAGLPASRYGHGWKYIVHIKQLNSNYGLSL